MSWNEFVHTQPTQTSSGHLKKVTMSYDQTRRRHDVWKKTSDLQRLEDLWFMSSCRHPIYDFLKGLIYDVFRTSGLQRPGDVWITSSWRRPICNVLKTSDLQRLQDVWFTTFWKRSIYVVLKTSNLWRLEDIWFMTSWKRL